MPVTSVETDPDALTMRITAELAAPAERAWQLWADPRQLERWWGPPTYPATVEEHDLTPGGGVTYVMTGPEGDRHRGWWRVVAVDPPRHLALVDGFARADGTPDPDMPEMTMEVALHDLPGGRTSMVITTRFPSAAAMQQQLEMGMDQGMAAALGQIDGILAAADTAGS